MQRVTHPFWNAWKSCSLLQATIQFFLWQVWSREQGILVPGLLAKALSVLGDISSCADRATSVTGPSPICPPSPDLIWAARDCPIASAGCCPGTGLGADAGALSGMIAVPFASTLLAARISASWPLDRATESSCDGSAAPRIGAWADADASAFCAGGFTTLNWGSGPCVGTSAAVSAASGDALALCGHASCLQNSSVSDACPGEAAWPRGIKCRNGCSLLSGAPLASGACMTVCSSSALMGAGAKRSAFCALLGAGATRELRMMPSGATACPGAWRGGAGLSAEGMGGNSGAGIDAGAAACWGAKALRRGLTAMLLGAEGAGAGARSSGKPPSFLSFPFSTCIRPTRSSHGANAKDLACSMQAADTHCVTAITSSNLHACAFVFKARGQSATHLLQQTKIWGTRCCCCWRNLLLRRWPRGEWFKRWCGKRARGQAWRSRCQGWYTSENFQDLFWRLLAQWFREYTVYWSASVGRELRGKAYQATQGGWRNDYLEANFSATEYLQVVDYQHQDAWLIVFVC